MLAAVDVKGWGTFLLEVLSVKSVSKVYPGVTALHDVSFSLRPGEIRALCGENGAGKSTLVKILMGIVQPDSGSIAINGEFRWSADRSKRKASDWDWWRRS